MEISLTMDTVWPYGTRLAEELLSAIALLTTERNLNPLTRYMQRIDNPGFKCYWAGDVLRLDIHNVEFRG